MWQYEKKLQFPINIKTTNTKLANFIISQYGGPDRNCYIKPFQNLWVAFCRISMLLYERKGDKHEKNHIHYAGRVLHDDKLNRTGRGYYRPAGRKTASF